MQITAAIKWDANLAAEPGVPLIHGRAELDIHDARIRKSVLEEAAQEALKWNQYDDATTQRLILCQQITQLIARDIRALAERPAPAGEVKEEK